jgi:hypothetical protein
MRSGSDISENRTRPVNAFVNEDGAIHAFERRPLHELLLGDALFEFGRRNAQRQGYSVELPPGWARSKAAANSSTS